MKAAEYAQAIYDAGEKVSVKHVREALTRRGHIKLMPQIYREYEKLLLRRDRLEKHKKITPTQERTRILLELYKKLIATH